MNMPKALKSRTVNLGLLLAIAGFLQTQMHVFNIYLSPEQQGLATMLLGLIVVVLRFQTTQPVSEK